MRRRRWIFVLFVAVSAALCVFPASAQPVVQYDGYKVLRAYTSDTAELDLLLSLNPDVWSERTGIGSLDVCFPPTTMPAMDATGIPYDVLIDDVQVLIDAQSGGSGQGPQGPTWFDDFRTYDEVNAKLQELQTQRPDLVTLFDAGTSLEGRSIFGVTITAPGPDKPAIFFQGCQHAREWIAVMVPMYLADRLIQDYDSDPYIQDLLDRVEIFIVPIVNPDGYVYTQIERLWRKNRRDNLDGTFGVDLNRNWSFGWGGPGSSSSTNSSTYHGTGPFSEPESTAIRDLVLANPQILAMIDIHCYSQLLLEPWAYITDPHPDEAIYDVLCGEMVDDITAVHDEPYVHGPGSTILYVAAGVNPDWAVGELGIIGMTIELRDTGQFGFVLPPEQIIPTCEEMFPAFLHVADFVTHPLQFDPGVLPEFVEPNIGNTVSVEIQEVNGGALDPASTRLFARVGNSGPFTEIPMSPSGGLHAGDLPPAPCNSEIEYYFQAQSTLGQAATSPTGAPDFGVFTTTARNSTIVFDDDFESDLGWTVSGDATDGQWDQGLPAGGGDRGDPATDADTSGQCYLTDNVDGNSDVDGGSTILTSPIMDASIDDAYISYWRWYDNVYGSAPHSDSFEVEISDDGGASWVTLEIIGPFEQEVYGGWVFRSFRVADFVAQTDEFRIRFIASDFGSASVVEAAVDGVRLTSYSCAFSGELIRGDSNADGNFDIVDAILSLQHIFLSPGLPCEVAADVDDDDSIGIVDPLYALASLFQGGPVPLAPFPGCGADPTPGTLTCLAFGACP